MNLAKMARGHAAEIRARLWHPPNAVPDHGIDLGGKAAKAARAEIIQRNIIEHMQFSEAGRRSAKDNRR